MRIGLQTERFAGNAQLDIIITINAISYIGAVDGVFTMILEPESGIKEIMIIKTAAVDTKGIKTQMRRVTIITALPVFIAVIGPQRAAEIQTSEIVRAALADMRKRLAVVRLCQPVAAGDQQQRKN